MKSRALAFVLPLGAALAGPGIALAKLGETREQIRQRYGDVLGQQTLAGLPAEGYRFTQFAVVVCFKDDRSVVESLTPLASDKKLSDAESLALIKAVSGTNGWKKDRAVKVFEEDWTSENRFVAWRKDGLLKTEMLVVANI